MENPQDSRRKLDEKVVFRSENIGDWMAKQDDLFAEQNRRAAELAKRSAVERQKAKSVLIGVGCAMAVAIMFLGGGITC